MDIETRDDPQWFIQVYNGKSGKQWSFYSNLPTAAEATASALQNAEDHTPIFDRPTYWRIEVSQRAVAK